MADLTQQFPIIGTTILFHQEAQVIDTGRCVLCRRKTHGIRPLSYPTDQWESDPGDLSYSTLRMAPYIDETGQARFRMVPGFRNGTRVAVIMRPSEHCYSGGRDVISCYGCQNDGKKYHPLMEACRRVGGWTL